MKTVKEYNLMTPLVLIDSIRKILELDNSSLVNSAEPLVTPYNLALSYAKELGLSTLVYQLEKLDIDSQMVPPQMYTLKTIQNKLGIALSQLHLEAGEVNLALLNDSATSARFSAFDQEKLSDSGQLFYSETRQCLRIGAYRATVVNAWLLCMDFVQEWISSDEVRLDKFNTRLATYINRKTNKPIYSSITNKEDFWESSKCPSERIILDCLLEQIGEKLHRKLVAALDDRNEFAHANSVELELEKTNGYISSILDILENSKFE